MHWNAGDLTGVVPVELDPDRSPLQRKATLLSRPLHSRSISRGAASCPTAADEVNELTVRRSRNIDKAQVGAHFRLLHYGTGADSQRPVRLYMLMSGTTLGPPSIQRPPGNRSHCTCPSTKAKLLPSLWRGGS